MNDHRYLFVQQMQQLIQCHLRMIVQPIIMKLDIRTGIKLEMDVDNIGNDKDRDIGLDKSRQLPLMNKRRIE